MSPELNTQLTILCPMYHIWWIHYNSFFSYRCFYKYFKTSIYKWSYKYSSFIILLPTICLTTFYFHQMLLAYSVRRSTIVISNMATLMSWVCDLFFIYLYFTDCYPCSRIRIMTVVTKDYVSDVILWQFIEFCIM